MGNYPRDLKGYGEALPRVTWPEGKRLAVQFVLNYEEGGENCTLHGDAGSEKFLSEIVGAEAIMGERHMSMESLYEYGSRVGVWRVLDLFRQQQVPLTMFAVATALQRNPLVAEVALKDGHEICSHGLKWINYQDVPEHIEAEHMAKAIEIIKSITGERPYGWYTGRTSPNTRGLVAAEGGFLYDADDYSDDLPFWSKVAGAEHLIVPYTLDANDMRFLTPQGFNTGDHFYSYLKDTFDTLYAEGETTPKMMSIGLHCRIIGKPGRIQALQKFLKYVQSHGDVWLAKRIDIAKHWRENHPVDFVNGGEK